MHEMRAAADLDVALVRRRGEGVEQPARVRIGAVGVPFAADDRDWRADETWLVGEFAGPGVENVLKRAARHLDGGGRAAAAVRIDVEIALAPLLEVTPVQDRRRVLG